MNPNAAINLLPAAAALVATGRLAQLKLVRQFPALFAYLGFVAASFTAASLLDQSSQAYLRFYLAVTPLECILSVMAVRELIALALDRYAGIRTIGRWVMYSGVAIGLTFSLWLTGFFWSSGAAGRAHSHTYYFEISKRAVVFSLACVIAAVLVFLSRYPVKLGKNTLSSCIFFSCLFLSETVRLLIDSLAPQLNNAYVDLSENLFVAICIFCWAGLLGRESTSVPTPVRFATPREDQLLQQLESLNQMLVRAARR